MLDFWDDLLDDGRLEDRATSPRPGPIASLAGTVDPGAGRERRAHLPADLELPAPAGLAVGGPRRDQRRASTATRSSATRTRSPTRTPGGPLSTWSHRLRRTSSRRRSTRCGPWSRPTPRPRSSRRLCSTSARCGARPSSRPPTASSTAGRGSATAPAAATAPAPTCGGTSSRRPCCSRPIARSFRRTQFARCTDDRGLMSFRAGLPAAEHSRTWRPRRRRRADGLPRPPLPRLEAERRRRAAWPRCGRRPGGRWSSAGSPAAGTPTGTG